MSLNCLLYSRCLSDRSQWFFGGVVLSLPFGHVCLCIQVSTSLCCGERGVEQRTIGDLSPIDCSHRCTHSSGISVTACWAHLTPHTFRTLLLLLLLPMSESEAFHLRAVCSSSSRDRAFISISSRVTIIMYGGRDMWWWCKLAPASQQYRPSQKWILSRTQDIGITRQQTESTSRHSVTLTCPSLLCIGRNDGTAATTSREKQIKYKCACAMSCCRYLVVCSRTRMSKGTSANWRQGALSRNLLWHGNRILNKLFKSSRQSKTLNIAGNL